MLRKDTGLQELTDRVQNNSKRFGLKINGENRDNDDRQKPEKMEVRLEGKKLEKATEFVYLGGLITEDARCTKDIR